jgi:transposase-like protein
LTVGKIETDLGCDVAESSSPVATSEVRVRRVPVPTRGDRRRGPLVSAVQLSYRDVEELLLERSVEVDHVTVNRWVQRFTPLLADAARFCRHSPGARQAWHHGEQYANNPIEADHSRLKHRLRPMRGLLTDRTAQVIIAGHAFMQNVPLGSARASHSVRSPTS